MILGMITDHFFLLSPVIEGKIVLRIFFIGRRV